MQQTRGGLIRVNPYRDVSRLLFGHGEPGAMFDVSDISTLFQDSAGTIPAVVGSPVGMMMDVSGNGNHATQPTAINRPVLQRDSAGRLYLAFNGTNSWMSISSLDMSSTPRISASVGFKIIVDQPAVLIELSFNANTSDGAFVVALHSTDGSFPPGINTLYRANIDPVYTEAFQNPAPPFPGVITSLMDISAPKISLRVNGSLSYSNQALSGTGNFNSWPFYIGARVSDTSTFSNGNLYGLVVRGALSSNIEITETESWLNARIGAY